MAAQRATEAVAAPGRASAQARGAGDPGGFGCGGPPSGSDGAGGVCWRWMRPPSKPGSPNGVNYESPQSDSLDLLDGIPSNELELFRINRQKKSTPRSPDLMIRTGMILSSIKMFSEAVLVLRI